MIPRAMRAEIKEENKHQNGIGCTRCVEVQLDGEAQKTKTKEINNLVGGRFSGK